nr:TetR/AcrR family transcriptional regulator [Dactylosporangium thailandense]
MLAAALDLLDADGLEALSMRRLSSALGVQNGATYWHFRSKQALLEAMADALIAGVAAGGPPVAELARRLRRALLSRRDGALLFSGRFFPLPNALAYGEALIAALRAGGLGAREAAWAADTVTYHVIGHVIEEQMAASEPDPAAAASRLTAAVDPARHPNLAAALPHVAAPHPEEHFEFGLRIVLAGIGAA